jgi:hypothetical protein
LDSIEELAKAYVQHEVLGYVRSRKRSGDTFKGIFRWWLHEQRRSIGRAAVRSALDALVARGDLKSTPLPGGDHFYSVPRPHAQPQQQE